MPRPSRRLRFAAVVIAVLAAAVFSGLRSGSETRAARMREKAAVLGGPNITATKTAALAPGGDGTGNNLVNPGDTIRYTITLSNALQGTSDAANTILTDTLAPDLTLVPGSVKADPVAVNDIVPVTGNIRVQKNAAGGLLSNDFNPITGTNANFKITTLAGVAAGAPFTSFTGGTSAQGGDVSSSSQDGAFAYDPPAGYEGNDSFTYVVTDTSTGLTATGTVNITVTGMIWFVDNTPGPPACTTLAAGCGRLTKPFTDLTSFLAINNNTGRNPGDNDSIFLYTGTGTYAIGGFSMRNGQKLIGQGATDTVQNISGLTPAAGSDALPTTGGTRPTITGTTTGVTVATNNTIRGITIGNVPNGAGSVAFKLGGVAFGTLRVGDTTSPDVQLVGNGRALDFTNGTFHASSKFIDITSTASAAHGIFLNNIHGTVNFGNTTIQGPTSQGINIAGSDATMTFGTTSVTGGSIAGISIGTSTGNITFGGTTVTGGTEAINLNGNSAGLRTFASLNISGGSGNAFIHSNNGANGGGDVTVTGTASISTAGNAISVSGPSSGDLIDFQGATTTTTTGAAATAVNYSGAAGAELKFNSLTINRNNGTALNATGGGTVTVTNNSGSITNTTAGGPAIVAANVTLNAAFAAINSTGGTNGMSFTNVSGTSNFGTTNFQNNTGVGILIGTSSIDSTFGNTTVNSSAGDAVDLAANTGDTMFGDLDLTPNATFRGLDAQNNTGTISSTSGDVIATGAAALFVDGPAGRTPLSMVLNNVDSTNSSAEGISLIDVSGNLTINDATVAANITNPTGIGINVQNSSGTLNLGNTQVIGSGGTGVALGTTTGNSGNVTFGDLDISPDSGQRAFDSRESTGTLTATSGTITTSGAATAAAVFVDGPAGRTPINLTFTNITTSGVGNSTNLGGITLVDVSGTKFQVTGTTQINTRAGMGVFVDNSTATSIQFATVNVPNPNAAGGDGFHVEDTSSAITVATATISNANVTIPQNDANTDFVPDNDGDGNAIFLRGNTGGSFTLNGGTLSECGNDCIDLRNSQSFAVSGVTIDSPGVDESGATGTGFGGHGIQAYNLTGTNTITNSTITDWETANRHGLFWNNHSSTASALTIHGSTFSNSANGAAAIFTTARDNANMTFNVGGTSAGQPCTFLELDAFAIISNAGDNANSTATVNTNIRNNTFTNISEKGNNAVAARNAAGGHANILVSGNTFDGGGRTTADTAGMIDIGGDGLDPGNTVSFTVTNNIIRNIGDNIAGSCGALPCTGKRGIDVFIDDNAVVSGTPLIDGNIITNVQRAGIFYDHGSVWNGASYSVKITNNRIGIRADNTIDRVGIGSALGAAGEHGLFFENRGAGGDDVNLLFANNLVYNGTSGGSTLNGTSVVIRTHNTATMNATVANNTVNSANTSLARGFYFGTVNAGTPVLCADASGNNITAAGGGFNLVESPGTLNIEQANSGALSSANTGNNSVTIAAGSPSFGVPCSAPPAIASPGEDEGSTGVISHNLRDSGSDLLAVLSTEREVRNTHWESSYASGNELATERAIALGDSSEAVEMEIVSTDGVMPSVESALTSELGAAASRDIASLSELGAIASVDEAVGSSEEAEVSSIFAILTEFAAKAASQISPTVYSQEADVVLAGETVCIKGDGTTTAASAAACTGPGFAIPSGATVKIYFDAQVAPVSGMGAIDPTHFSVSNQGTVAGSNFGPILTDGDTGTAGAQATVTTIVQPETITKSFSPATNPIDAQPTLTFTITNANPATAANGITFTDVFPTSPGAMTVAALPMLPADNTCGGTIQNSSGGVLAVGDPGIKLINGTLPVGGAGGVSCTIKIKVKADMAGTYTNTTGTISSTEGAVGLTATNNVTFTVLTAAGVSVSGRVLSFEGRGVRNVKVTLTDAQGVSRSVASGQHGEYRFDDVPAGYMYSLRAGSRRFTFTPQMIAVTDELTGFDLTAEP